MKLTKADVAQKIADDCGFLIKRDGEVYLESVKTPVCGEGSPQPPPWIITPRAAVL